MGYKQTDATLEKTGDDEPIFVLVARDRLAPDLVEEWAREAQVVGVPMAKVGEAMRLAAEMRHWQHQNPDKVKTPD